MKCYLKYKLNIRDVMKCVLKSTAAALIIGYLFFKGAVYALPFFVPILLFNLKTRREKAIKEQCQRLNCEFRDALCSMAASLEAGYSIEGAVAEAEKDMVLMHGEEAMMRKELQYLLRRLQNGGSAEEGFENFAERSGSEDAKNFAEVFVIAKRTGGELIKVIDSITSVMQEKLEANREISLLIASKKYEIRIMKYMPAAILAYMRLTSPEFVEPLYQEGGRLFMLLLLPIWCLLTYASEKIMDIRV